MNNVIEKRTFYAVNGIYLCVLQLEKGIIVSHLWNMTIGHGKRVYIAICSTSKGCLFAICLKVN